MTGEEEEEEKEERQEENEEEEEEVVVKCYRGEEAECVIRIVDESMRYTQAHSSHFHPNTEDLTPCTRTLNTIPSPFSLS